MEEMNVKRSDKTCQRCGCTEGVGIIGLCQICESNVDNEYALMYGRESSMEIVEISL